MDSGNSESVKNRESTWKRFTYKSFNIRDLSKSNFKEATFLWKFGFPVLLLLVAIWSSFLLFDGFSSVLKSEDGVTREAITDPLKEGFEAFVEQTWAELIVTEDATGELVQVAVISISDRQTGGGTVLLLPPELETGGCVSDCSLKSLYLKSGAESARRMVSELLETEFTGITTLTPERWTTLIQPLGEVNLEFDGRMQKFEPLEIFDFISRKNENNFLVRQKKQGEFWRSWLEGMVLSGDVDASLPVMRIPVVELISTLAKGPFTVVDNLWYDSGGSPEADPKIVSSLIAEMFPFPAPTEGDLRATIRLLNGTDDPSLSAEMQKLIRENDGNITVIGNFRSFNVIQTRVVYKDFQMKSKAEKLAAAIGAHVIKDEMVSPVADLTVLIGRDFNQ